MHTEFSSKKVTCLFRYQKTWQYSQNINLLTLKSFKGIVDQTYKQNHPTMESTLFSRFVGRLVLTIVLSKFQKTISQFQRKFKFQNLAMVSLFPTKKFTKEFTFAMAKTTASERFTDSSTSNINTYFSYDNNITPWDTFQRHGKDAYIVLLDIGRCLKMFEEFRNVSHLWMFELDYLKFAVIWMGKLFVWLEDSKVHVINLRDDISKPNENENAHFEFGVGKRVEVFTSLDEYNKESLQSLLERASQFFLKCEKMNQYSYKYHSLTFSDAFLTSIVKEDTNHLFESILTRIRSKLTSRSPYISRFEKMIELFGKEYRPLASLDVIDRQRCEQYYLDLDISYVLPEIRL